MTSVAGAVGLAAVVVAPGLAWLAAGARRKEPPWPWTTAAAVVLAAGVAAICLCGTALGVAGAFGPASLFGAIGIFTVAMFRRGRRWFRAAVSSVSVIEAAGFLVVAAVAAVLFSGRPFEMLAGGQDATTYLVGGVALARTGGLVVEDPAAAILGPEFLQRIYPELPAAAFGRSAEAEKYQGFYYLDRISGRILPQGLPGLTVAVAAFAAFFGLPGALAAPHALGFAAVLAVFATTRALFGPLAAALGSILLAANPAEVWAARYPMAEILLQLLYFGAAAAFLRGGRTGETIAGACLGALLFVKLEALLLVVPFAATAAALRARGRPIAGVGFWLALGGLSIVGAAYWLAWHGTYLHMVVSLFIGKHRSLLHRLGGNPVVAGSGAVLLGALAIVAAIFRRRIARGRGGARLIATTVPLGVAWGWLIRPWLPGPQTGGERTFLWLVEYVGPEVVLGGTAALAVHLWREARAREVCVLSGLLVFAAAFFEFSFAVPYHIYVTRRFVPAALPLVCIAYGAFVSALATEPGPRRLLARSLAVLLTLVSLGSTWQRSRHVYEHREYAGASEQFARLAGELRRYDLVLLGDRVSRNVFGPALDLVYGIPMAVVPVENLGTVRPWLDRHPEWRVGLVTHDTSPEVAGVEGFDLVADRRLVLRLLERAFDRIPTRVLRVGLPFRIYERGVVDRLIPVACRAGVRIVGGNGPLVARLRRSCPHHGAKGRDLLVTEAEADSWRQALRVHGARFRERELRGAVLFERIAPEKWPGSEPIAPSEIEVRASPSNGSEAAVFDGRPETRWGSGTPQRPGMVFLVRFRRPMDVSWVRLRTGAFPWDRDRGLAVETSKDGAKWESLEVPAEPEGLLWKRDRLVPNTRGDRDVWIGKRGIRWLRLVARGEHPRYDWSIAELQIEGHPAAGEER